ncbi:MAG: SUMF1/EgtB/PvdO family nonheme iron enzyme, partial [Methyloprofundus sp.]|nr:SUMF1/EgtB/PvdO family nonheme iron enzyme [Methyloprofundus sp.]
MNHPNYLDLPPQFPPDYACAWGEDRYGLWFELLIKTIVQRFRWIPAGEFTMGSPTDEKEREFWGGKETQHLVALSQDYWLADTACTQALSEMVMGDNPAEFTDDIQSPVETVSWDDIQAFLQQLNQQYPELQAQLPSEAQWEYACRAGTVTPFSFGDNITPEQVNYDGNYPYADAEKGEFREKTIAVKSLPANQWGLYAMHGNVWEWCQDEWRDDLGTAAVEYSVSRSTKQGGDEGVSRVLRGGSWRNDGRNCRSALRYFNSAGLRYRYYGFRFSLGH